MRFFALVAIAAMVASSAARADTPAKPITRNYDIRRLIFHPHDFTDAPDLAPKAANAVATTRPAPKDPSRDEIVAGILKSVRGMLPGASAEDVFEEKGILHVTAPSADQARVDSALARRLRVLSTQITVQTQLFSISHKDVAGLDPAVRSLLDDASFGDDPVTIDEGQVRNLLVAIDARKESTRVAEPRITLFQNQRAYVLVASQQAYISGYALDKSVLAKAVYKPVMSDVEDGIVLDVRASAASSDGLSAVSLDCHDQFSQLHGMRDSTWTDPTTHEKRPIQIPDFSKQTIDRLLTILPGHSVLLRFADPGAFGIASNRSAKADQDCFILITAQIVAPSAEKKS